MIRQKELRAAGYAGAVALVAAVFYVSSLYSYLLFHSLVEIITAAIGFALLALTWNARRFLETGCLKILGIGYGLIAVIDLVHTLAYRGMNVLPGYDANLPTQLWIAARYLQAATLCVAPIFAVRNVDERKLMAIFGTAVVVLVALPMTGRFPDCFIEGQGLTPFKIGSEYLITGILGASLLLFRRHRASFDPTVYRMIIASIVCTAISELSFTAYLSVYGFANLLGHLLKLAAFGLVYRALLVTGFSRPFELIFMDLKRADEGLRKANETLEEKVRERTAQLDHLNRELRALSNCNQILMRARDERSLLEAVCRIVCSEAGYRMAWVGYVVRDEAKTVRPVAWGGAEDGYLSRAGITWSDTEHGHGPAGLAIRTGATACIQDFATAPEALPWRADAVAHGYRSSIALPLMDADGGVFGVLCIYSSEPDAFTPDEARLLEELAGDLAFGVTVLRARNELETAEEHIRELNRDLEHRVEVRTTQLQEANRELESFSYSVSHDLRAPLRAIDGFARILDEDYRSTLNADGQHCVDAIHQNAVRMGRLIEDILAFSRTSRHELAFSTLDMKPLVQEVFDELRAAEPDRAVFLRLDELPPAKGDRALIRQVLVNLMSNALKFTAPRKDALIEVSGVRNEGESTYCIKDNGVGFDMEYRERLFGVFQRLHRQEDFDGTGIGLAIVKRIVVRHGGRVWADGQPDAGARFWFTLPAP